MKARAVEAVVTFLSMERPPATYPPRPTGAQFALMKAERIPVHYYRYLYGEVGRNWLWIERHGLGDEELSAAIHKDGIDVFILYANGVPAGFFELEFDQARRANLAYFGLMPDWTGRGIGPWLLGCAVSEAFSRGIDRLTVNTCTFDHPAALPLYQRLCFEPVEQRVRSVTIPADLAIPGHIAARMSA